jgi:phosphopantothenoylcysteine decarboxylase/phosphopantothenate--cysteine ligase
LPQKAADLLENAGKKLLQKNLDMIVANDVSRRGRLQCRYEPGCFSSGDGRVEDILIMGKSELADLILDRVVELRGRG